MRKWSFRGARPPPRSNTETLSALPAQMRGPRRRRFPRPSSRPLARRSWGAGAAAGDYNHTGRGGRRRSGSARGRTAGARRSTRSCGRACRSSATPTTSSPPSGGPRRGRRRSSRRSRPRRNGRPRGSTRSRSRRRWSYRFSLYGILSPAQLVRDPDTYARKAPIFSSAVRRKLVSVRH